jgi:hypothetical protein
LPFSSSSAVFGRVKLHPRATADKVHSTTYTRYPPRSYPRSKRNSRENAKSEDEVEGARARALDTVSWERLFVAPSADGEGAEAAMYMDIQAVMQKEYISTNTLIKG